VVSTRLARELLDTDPVSGKPRGLVATIGRALRAMNNSGVGYCVIGATALAVRGLPRMTADLDLVVMIDDAARAIEALGNAGLDAATPPGTAAEPESMVVFVDPVSGVDVDLLVAAGDPEARVLGEADEAEVFGHRAPVATLEHLLLLYLYSNQPKHLGDFAAIVQSRAADLGRAERSLADMHPEMLGEWRARVEQALAPPAAPPRPPRRS
jgi:hypothetical protein